MIKFDPSNIGNGWVPVDLTDFKSDLPLIEFVAGGFDSHTFPPML